MVCQAGAYENIPLPAVGRTEGAGRWGDPQPGGADRFEINEGGQLQAEKQKETTCGQLNGTTWVEKIYLWSSVDLKLSPDSPREASRWPAQGVLGLSASQLCGQAGSAHIMPHVRLTAAKTILPHQAMINPPGSMTLLLRAAFVFL